MRATRCCIEWSSQAAFSREPAPKLPLRSQTKPCGAGRERKLKGQAKGQAPQLTLSLSAVTAVTSGEGLGRSGRDAARIASTRAAIERAISRSIFT